MPESLRKSFVARRLGHLPMQDKLRVASQCIRMLAALLTETRDDDLAAALDLHVRAIFVVCREVARGMVAAGHRDDGAHAGRAGLPRLRAVALALALGRNGRLEDVMGAVVFLRSNAAARVTGSAPMVDGGWTAA